MSRTYTGVVVSVDATEASPQVHVNVASRQGETWVSQRLALRASVRTALDAIPLVGRRVRFQAELSEHTQCLTSPVFVIGSSYGLRAIDGAAAVQTTTFGTTAGPDGVPLIISRAR
jgi:hypothetical protein